MIAAVRRRLPVVALVGFTVVVVLVTRLAAPRVPPAAVYSSALVVGCALALHAVALCLVFRSNRIVNFAQVQMSVLGGLLFASLVQRRLPLVGLHAACGPCLRVPRTVAELGAGGERGEQLLKAAGLFGLPGSTPLSDAAATVGRPIGRSTLAAAVAPSWLVHASYWLSFVVAVALVVGLVWVVHAVFIKRFNEAPRLVLTVATLGAGEFALAAGRMLMGPLLSPGAGEPEVTGAATPALPTLDVGPVVLRPAELLTVCSAVVAVALVGWLLARSSVGLMMRGAAENPDRAKTLGVRLESVTSRAWMLAGALGGLAAVLTTARVGTSGLGGSATLVEASGAAVVGGLVSLPLAACGALAIAVVNQSVLWATGTGAFATALLVLFIATMLAAGRVRSGRAEIEAQSTWRGSREIRPVPDELRAHRAVRGARFLVSSLVAATVLGYPWFMSPSQVSLGQTTVVLAILGLSMLVLTGWGGQISLGQVGFAAVGAWAASASGAPLVLALPLGGVAGGLAAMAVGASAIRLRGLHLAVVTLAFGSAASALFLDGDALGRFLKPMERPVVLGLDLHDERVFYYFVVLLLAGFLTAVAGLRRSRIARALIAARENEQAAEAYGVNLLRCRLAAFGVAGAMAGVAGVLLALAQGGVETETYAPGRSVAVFLATVIGGVGSLSGPVLGAVLMGGIRLLTTTPLAPVLQLVEAGGLFVVVVLLLMPGGVAQGVFGLRDAWLRRIAVRDRIHVPSLLADTGDRAGAVPLAPKESDGAPAYVPTRYRLHGQWMAERMRREVALRGDGIGG